jgi:hypothetical protein
MTKRLLGVVLCGLLLGVKGASPDLSGVTRKNGGKT